MASSAFAVATLQFSGTGFATFSCADGAACDGNPLAGVVQFSGPLGNFLVNVSTGISKPVFTHPKMDLNSVNVQASGPASTLNIEFSDDFFTVPSPQFDLQFGGTIGGGSVTVLAFLDEGNALFAGNLIGSLGPFSGGAFSGNVFGPGTADTSYSLSQKLTLNSNGPVFSFSGDFALNPVPEPASVALFMGMLVVTGTAIRRKMKV